MTFSWRWLCKYPSSGMSRLAVGFYRHFIVICCIIVTVFSETELQFYRTVCRNVNTVIFTRLWMLLSPQNLKIFSPTHVIPSERQNKTRTKFPLTCMQFSIFLYNALVDLFFHGVHIVEGRQWSSFPEVSLWVPQIHFPDTQYIWWPWDAWCRWHQ